MAGNAPVITLSSDEENKVPSTEAQPAKPSRPAKKGKQKHFIVTNVRQTLFNQFQNTVDKNQDYCHHCKDGGSLLTCDKCPRSFHLVCINLEEADVPYGPWFCSYCQTTIERRYRDEQTKASKEERILREKQLKNIVQLLSSSKKDKALAQFGEKYPQYMRAGKINYPIEDRLILEDLDLHGIGVPVDRPDPKPLSISCDIIGDILYITDFAHNFASILQLTHFTPNQLYSSLTDPEPTELLSELIMSLVFHTVEFLIVVPDEMPNDYKMTWLIRKYQKQVNLYDIVAYQWEQLLNEVLCQELWAENQNDSVPKYIESYWGLPYSERVETIKYLINCLFDCKVLHDEIQTRLETKEKLSKEKNELILKIRAEEAHLKEASAGDDVAKLRNTRAMNTLVDKIERLKRKLADYQDKLADVSIRTHMLGMDRDFNEYFLFRFDTTRLYVKTSNPVDQQNFTEEGYWYAYDSLSELQTLQQSLCNKGHREAKLIEALKAAAKRFDFNDPEANMDLEDPEYENRESEFPEKEYDLEDCSKTIGIIETNITRFLTKIHKQWGETAAMDTWRAQVKSIEQISDLCGLIKELADFVGNPYKIDSEESQVDDKHLISRVTLKIWNGSSGLYDLFMNMLSEVNSPNGLMFLLTIYSYIIDVYAEKKRERLNSIKVYHSPIKTRKFRRNYEVPVARPRRLRKVYQKQSSSSGSESNSSDESQSSSEDEGEHDDTCFLCGKYGEVACCEGCTKVVHPKCIGLDSAPEGDWYCDVCQEKKDKTRQTRSTTRRR